MRKYAYSLVNKHGLDGQNYATRKLFDQLAKLGYQEVQYETRSVNGAWRIETIIKLLYDFTYTGYMVVEWLKNGRAVIFVRYHRLMIFSPLLTLFHNVHISFRGNALFTGSRALPNAIWYYRYSRYVSFAFVEIGERLNLINFSDEFRAGLLRNASTPANVLFQNSPRLEILFVGNLKQRHNFTLLYSVINSIERDVLVHVVGSGYGRYVNDENFIFYGHLAWEDIVPIARTCSMGYALSVPFPASDPLKLYDYWSLGLFAIAHISFERYEDKYCAFFEYDDMLGLGHFIENFEVLRKDERKSIVEWFDANHTWEIRANTIDEIAEGWLIK